MWLLIRMTQLEVCKTEWSISLVRGVKTPQPRLLDIKANPVSALTVLKLTAIVLLPKQNSLSSSDQLKCPLSPYYIYARASDS